MERAAIHESLALGAGFIVAIEKPPIAGNANLKQHAVAGIGAGPRVLFAQVKPALLAFPAIGPEDRLDSKGFGPRKWMAVTDQGFLHAIELHCLADWRIDHSRRAEHRRLVPADIPEPVEAPNGRFRGRCDSRPSSSQRTQVCNQVVEVALG